MHFPVARSSEGVVGDQGLAGFHDLEDLLEAD
jgi:hypothetical protein